MRVYTSMEIKRVSVHIVTYNNEDDIWDCLSAVTQQNYPIQQILVIDNQSGDATISRVSLCCEKMNISLKVVKAEENTSGKLTKNNNFELTLNNPKPIRIQGTEVILIRNTDNTGFAPAHNAAINRTDTDYCLVLNPDVTLAPDYVSRLVSVMEANPRIGSATGKLLLKRDPSLVDSTGLWMNRARRAFDRGMEEPAERWNESGEVFGVSGAAALYSRRMIEDIRVDGEFFDGDFFAYKEDVDVAWRARLYGWTAYYDAEALGYHERGWKPSGRSDKALFIRRISYINRYKMLYKNEPARTLSFTLVVSLPYEIAAHGYMLLKERDLFGAWRLFKTQWRNLRQKRKEIQRVAAERRKTGRAQH